MEASALRQSAALPALAGRSPLLRLQSDERLIALTGAGTTAPSRCSSAATARGCSPSAATCSARRRTRRTCSRTSSPRPTTRSWPISARSTRGRGCTGSPATAASTTCGARVHDGRDTMDDLERDGGASTADMVHKRADFAIARRRPAASRDPAHGAAAARDRRAFLRPDRGGDGDDRAEREVAAGARADVARRGFRGPAADL